MKKKHSIYELNQLALSRGGRCLSSNYKGLKSKLKWECKYGHIWEASPNSIIHLKSWCPECAGNKKLDFQKIKQLASQNGGKCLSGKYKNSKEKLLWECKNGHRWNATVFSIKTRNSWCPVCNKFINKKLNVMKNLFQQKVLFAAIASVLVLSSCTMVKPGYIGVLNRPLGKGLSTEKMYHDGIYPRGVFTNLIQYDIRLRSYQEKIDILTSDALHTTIALSVTIQPTKEELPELILEVGENYYENIVKPNFFSVTRGIMAKYNYEEISTKSLTIETEITAELEKRLAGKHIELDKVTLDHIMYSPLVTNATDVKLATKQKLEQATIEVEIAEKKAEIQRIEAEGQRDAQQIIDQGLSQRYLQFKALEVQDKLSESNNAKFFFVPLGKEGLPIIVNASEDK